MTQNVNEVQFNMPQDSGMDIKKWVLRVLHLWPWIILSVILCSIGAYIYIRSTEPIFRSSASIMIRDREKGGAGLDNPTLQNLDIKDDNKYVDNEIVVLKSRDLMKDVVLKEQLYIVAKRKGTFSDRTVFRLDLPLFIEVANPDTITSYIQFRLFKAGANWMMTSNEQKPFNVEFGQKYMLGKVLIRFWPNKFFDESSKTGIDDYNISLVPVSSAVSNYISKLQVDAFSKTTSILTLSMVDNDPNKVSSILGTLINLYGTHGLLDKKTENSNVVEFLDERLDTIKNNLERVEGSIQAFQTKNKMVDIPSELSGFQNIVSTNNGQQAIQETQDAIVDELERSLREKKDTVVASSLGISEPTIGVFIQKYNLLVLQRDRLARYAGPLNPSVIDLENQIKDTKASILESIKGLKSANRITLNNLSNRTTEYSGKIGSVPELQKELIQIKRNQSVQEQLYLFLLQKKEESAIKLASTTTDTRTIEKPYSLGQVKPINKEIWTVAIFMGFLIPIAIFVLLVFLDNKIEDKKEIEKHTYAPLLGEIAYVKKLDNPIQITSKSRSLVAEQLRGIRTAISYTGKGETTKSILITSQRSGEGKSFTSLNLAASYAQLGKKVIVLEFDLRKPRMSRSLGLDPKVGISTYLSRDMSIDEIIIPLPNMDGCLFLLPAGPLPPNPSELILGQNMAKMYQELNERFDYIIFDTPPFGIITDATLLQQYADINIFVLRQGYTFKTVYNEINQRIQQFPTQPLYVVLNGVGKRKEYRTNSNYGYGYEYFDDVNKKPVNA